MSDSEEEHQAKLTQVLGRYKSTKGDADKRKETSKLNMAKARAAKLAGLKAAKEEAANEIEVSSSDSDESSDDEDLIISKKGKKGQKGGRAPPASSSEQMRRMEQMIMMLAKQKGKGKKSARKTVIQIAAPPSTPVLGASNPHANAMKQSIIQWD
jgi:hypothetical protein